MNKMPASYITFAGDDSTDFGVEAVEVTCRRPGGFAEIAFDHGEERIYLTLHLPELLALALRAVEEGTPEARAALPGEENDRG